MPKTIQQKDSEGLDIPSVVVSKGGLASSKQFKMLAEPPHIELSPPSLHFQSKEDTLFFERIQNNKELDDLTRYELLLSAEEIRLQNEFHYLLCEDEHSEYLGEHLFSSIQRILRDMHGRALLFHEPFFSARTELILTLKEYFLRGLVERVLVIVPSETLGFWATELKFWTGQTFQFAREIPDEEPPPFLILPIELFETPIRLNFMNEAHYSLVIFEGAERLTYRRSRLWRNIRSLSSSYLFLQSNLPFSNDVFELHGLLALLGVSELPSPALFRDELGGRDASITPVMRRAIRPYLKPVVLRHTKATTKVNDEKIQWKIRGCELSLSIEDWQTKLYQLIQTEQQQNSEPHLKKALLRLLQASFSSIEAGMSELSRLKESSLLSDSPLLAELLSTGMSVQRSDSRLKSLVSLLKSTNKARVLIFSHFEATRELLRKVLTESNLIQEDTQSVRIILATDDDISLPFGAIDWVIHFDLPWHPLFWMERSHLLSSFQKQPPHNIQLFVFLDSLEESLFSILDFRLKFESLHREELALILAQLPDAWQFPENLWNCFESEQKSEFFETLSAHLLQSRKLYRQKLDQNERLFLDDYTI